MKKLAAITAGLLSLGYLGAFELPAFGLDTGVGFSSEYIYRGRREGKEVFVPRAEINIPVFEKGKAYVGTAAFIGIDGAKDINENGEYVRKATRNKFDSYVGVSYAVADMFTLDAGYIHHFYTNTPKRVAVSSEESSTIEPSGIKRDTSEVYFGVLADVLLSPSVYFYYDFDAREVAIEGRVSYTFDLAQFGVNGVVLDLGAKLGYDSADRPFAKKGEFEGKKDYAYYGANADLVYSFNEHSKARVGVEVAGNSAKKSSWVNNAKWNESARASFVWFNASVDCSF